MQRPVRTRTDVPFGVRQLSAANGVLARRSVRLLVDELADDFACRIGSHRRIFDGEEMPWVGHAFECMGAAITEWDA